MEDRSIVEYLQREDAKGHPCGYCKNPKGSFSRGMWAHRMTCQDYQDLIDRGCRRSGKYVYKPTMTKSCCPPYTIKCDVINFKLSKSQKQVLKKMTKFLLSGAAGCHGIEAVLETKQGPQQRCPNDGTVTASSGRIQPGQGADPEKPRCRKAKEIRRERRLAKQLAQSSSCSTTVDITPSGETKHTTVDSSISSSAAAVAAGVDAAGAMPLEDLIISAVEEKDAVNKLIVSLVPCDMSNPDFQASYEESYQVYKKYQMVIHGETEEKNDKQQFKRFLVDSPLICSRPKDGPASGYGSFHQHYRLNGRLIAVGVQDILPYCVSSVYFFYDPEFNFLSLGVYSALREILFTQQLHQHTPCLQWYYMGYYIHTCQKMKYKGQYDPSYLLCPEVLTWVPYKNCVVKLDVSKYSRLDDQDSPQDLPIDLILPQVLVLSQRQAMTYEVFEAIVDSRSQDLVKDYVRVAGPIVATRMLLYLKS